MFKNIKDIQKFIKTNKVKFIDFKLVDLQGRFRHLSIPAERLTEKTMKEGIGFYEFLYIFDIFKHKFTLFFIEKI